MNGTINDLREIARCCLSGEPLESNLSEWLGESLQAFLDHACATVDDAFGLKFPQGGIPWWREEAIRTRDAALRELDARFFDDRSLSATAREVRVLADRYAASSWRFDRERDEMPRRYQETRQEFLWLAFKSGAAMPIGERQLRNILAK